MDVYYPWPYNRGEGGEGSMSEQDFAHQALGGFGNIRSAVPHAMPVPSGQPWNVQEMPWGAASPQPHLMQFTAQTSNCTIQHGSANLHCKRKPADLGPPVPAKQFISEEKMAAHLSGLHISSTYTSHQSEESMDMMEQPLSLSEQLKELKGRTLVLCDELKNLKQEPLIPTALLEKYEKPCMSLVVWKPKESILEKLEKKEESKERNPSEATKRQGVLIVPDENCMDVDMR